MFEVKIKTGGAAFQDPEGLMDDVYEGAEICRILEHIVAWIRNAEAYAGNCVDSNGNLVGEWRIY